MFATPTQCVCLVARKTSRAFTPPQTAVMHADVDLACAPAVLTNLSRDFPPLRGCLKMDLAAELGQQVFILGMIPLIADDLPTLVAAAERGHPGMEGAEAQPVGTRAFPKAGALGLAKRRTKIRRMAVWRGVLAQLHSDVAAGTGDRSLYRFANYTDEDLDVKFRQCVREAKTPFALAAKWATLSDTERQALTGAKGEPAPLGTFHKALNHLMEQLGEEGTVDSEVSPHLEFRAAAELVPASNRVRSGPAGHDRAARSHTSEHSSRRPAASAAPSAAAPATDDRETERYARRESATFRVSGDTRLPRRASKRRRDPIASPRVGHHHGCRSPFPPALAWYHDDASVALFELKRFESKCPSTEFPKLTTQLEVAIGILLARNASLFLRGIAGLIWSGLGALEPEYEEPIPEEVSSMYKMLQSYVNVVFSTMSS